MTDKSLVEETQKQLPAWVTAMQLAEPRFEELAKIHGAVNWKSEANFARQAMQKDVKLQTCGQQSIVDSIINVAAIGLSLSPADALAYLIPRKGTCVLDISYKGLIKLATDTGNCDYVRADIVREKDDFVYHGPAAMPDVSLNPFSNDRGSVVGAYAIAKLASGDVLCEVLTADDLAGIENASMANTGPWKGPFKAEMQKKSAIKRICKTIPRTAQSGRLHKAIAVINEHEGIVIEETHAVAYTLDQYDSFDSAIAVSDTAQLWHLSRSLPDGAWLDLCSSYYDKAPKGKKTEWRKKLDTMTVTGLNVFEVGAAQLFSAMQNDDEPGALEILHDFEGQMETLNEQLDESVIAWVAVVEPKPEGVE